jgi:hypothetical protein
MEYELKELKQNTSFKDARRKNRWLSNRILTCLIDETLDILDEYEEVCNKEEVAFHTCMNLLRFLSRRKLARSQLHTYMRTSLSLSTKFYCCKYIPLPRSLLVELQILEELKWSVGYPTPFNIRKYFDLRIPEQYERSFNAMLYLATRDPGYFDLQDKSVTLLAAVLCIQQKMHPKLDFSEIETLAVVVDTSIRLQVKIEDAKAIMSTITNPFGGVM